MRLVKNERKNTEQGGRRRRNVQKRGEKWENPCEFSCEEKEDEMVLDDKAFYPSLVMTGESLTLTPMTHQQNVARQTGEHPTTPSNNGNK